MQTISDKLHLFFCRSIREDARRKGQMNPSYRPDHRPRASIWSERGSWCVELTGADGEKAVGLGTTLQLAIEHAETKLYGW